MTTPIRSHSDRNRPASGSIRIGQLVGCRLLGSGYTALSDRASHYFHASLPVQFDAILHFDRTQAVEPLERTAEWQVHEVPGDVPLRSLRKSGGANGRLSRARAAEFEGGAMP